jgi:hypothetical protein
MKSCINSCIPSPCTCTFFKFCFVLEIKTFPVCSENRGKDLQNTEVGLNSKQGFCKSFQTKNQKKMKRKEKELGKE